MADESRNSENVLNDAPKGQSLLLFRPLLTYMTCLGLRFERRKLTTLLIFIGINLLHLFGVIRLGLCLEQQFRTRIRITVTDITFVIWVSSYYVIIWTFQVIMPRRFHRFTECLDQLHRNHETPMYFSTIFKRMKYFIGLQVVIVVISFLFFLFLVLPSTEAQTGRTCHLAPVTIDEPYFWPMVSVICLGWLVLMGGDQCIFGLFVMTCYILGKEFLFCRKKLCDIVACLYDGEQTKYKELEATRLRFEHVCNLTEQANSMCSFYPALVYAMNLPFICFIIYGVATEEYSVLNRTLILSEVILAAFYICSVTVLAAAVHSQAHSLLDDLLKLDLRQLSESERSTVSTFAARLTGPPIGISVPGITVIDSSFFLTLLATVLTYGIVVFQFKSPEGSITCQLDTLCKNWTVLGEN